VRRREFITLLGGAGVAWPLAARAQQAPMPVIGFLHIESPEPYAPHLAAFRKGLSEAGYVEGRNVAIEYRWAEGHLDRSPTLAAELVGRRVALIVAVALPSALAAKAATSIVPIVFQIGGDPLQYGLVASLNRPGANITGVTQLANTLAAKQLEMLHELVPKVSTIAMLVNPANPNASTDTRNVEKAAKVLGLNLLVLNVATERDLEPAFATLKQQHAGGVLVPVHVILNNAQTLVALAALHSIPAIYPWPETVKAGGLMSYGANNLESYQLCGAYAGRILKGEKPADLPVQQSDKVELHINLKTAKTLGITFPTTLLGRADEMIE
jgi:putative ABC transport system substrate-binding protein